MRNLALLAFFFVLSAQASDLSKYAVVGGGFGKDGATGESSPKPNSMRQAQEVFAKLNRPIDEKGFKNAGALDCRLNNCEVAVLMLKDQVGVPFKKVGGVDSVIVLDGANLSFTGFAAEELFSALPEAQSAVGAENRAAANVRCARVVYPKAKPKCTIEDTNFVAMDLGDMVKTGQVSRADAEEMVKGSGLEE